MLRREHILDVAYETARYLEDAERRKTTLLRHHFRYRHDHLLHFEAARQAAKDVRYLRIERGIL